MNNVIQIQDSTKYLKKENEMLKQELVTALDMYFDLVKRYEQLAIRFAEVYKEKKE